MVLLEEKCFALKKNACSKKNGLLEKNAFARRKMVLLQEKCFARRKMPLLQENASAPEQNGFAAKRNGFVSTQNGSKIRKVFATHDPNATNRSPQPGFKNRRRRCYIFVAAR
jgi:hypothetical protein